jgi:hypothetical protein
VIGDRAVAHCGVCRPARRLTRAAAGARAPAVARSRRDRRRVAGVAAVAGPALARALAGAGPARSRRFAAAIELHVRVPGRRGRGHRGDRCPHRRPGTLAGRVAGLALAGGGFDVPVREVIGLGIKVAWGEDELDRARALAHRSPVWFASRDEAAARYLRISGLTGLLTAAQPAVDAGLREQDGRWRLPWIRARSPSGTRYAATAGTIPAPGNPGPWRARRHEHGRAAHPAGRPHGHAARPGPQRTSRTRISRAPC